MVDAIRSWRNWIEPRFRRRAPAADPTGKPPDSLPELIGRVVRSADRGKLAEQLLARDPLYRRIRPDQKRAAVDFGLSVGKRVARELAPESGANPFALAETLGVKVSYADRRPRVGSRVHYSEYHSRPPSITIYRQSMAEVNAAICRFGLADVLGVSDITPVHLAHELYHHLELHRKPGPTAAFRITTLAVGPLHLDSGLMSLGEVAANAFAQELLGLPLYPTVFEFITVYAHNAELAWTLLDRLEGRSM